MGDSKDSFVFYGSWYDIIQVLGEDEQKDIIMAIVEYGLKGSKNYPVPTQSLFLEQIYAQIDAAQEKYERRIESARRGGKAGKGVSRNSGNKNAAKNNSKTIANNSKTIPNVNVNVNVNDNDNNNDNDNIHSHGVDLTVTPENRNKDKKLSIDELARLSQEADDE